LGRPNSIGPISDKESSSSANAIEEADRVGDGGVERAGVDGLGRVDNDEGDDEDDEDEDDDDDDESDDDEAVDDEAVDDEAVDDEAIDEEAVDEEAVDEEAGGFKKGQYGRGRIELALWTRAVVGGTAGKARARRGGGTFGIEGSGNVLLLILVTGAFGRAPLGWRVTGSLSLQCMVVK